MTENNTPNYKSRFGIFLILLGFICPIFGILIPLLGLPSGTTTGLVAFFMVGGPEIFLILGGILAGKEGVTLVSNKVKRLLGLPEGRYPAPRSQYNLAIFFIILWFLLAIIPGYVPSVFQWPLVEENLLWICITADVLLLVSIFGLGGDQMVKKIAAVFKWEPWKLPPERSSKG